MTTFPDQLDSDLEIPRIENDVSEIGGDTINALRDAIFAVQQTLGVNPQGNTASLNSRINISIDSNGNIKRDALEGIGLLALPVIDTHVGATAGIQESKLALDYRTTYLRNLISTLSTNLSGISAGLSSSSAGINSHFLGQGNYHDGYHIKINLDSSIGIAGMEETTVGGILNEFSARLLSGNDSITPHIDLNIPSSTKHRSSEISVSASSFTTIDSASQNVQETFESLDAQQGILGVKHIDEFHANGVLKEINSGTYYNSSRELLESTSGISYSEGTSVIKIPGITSFSSLNITTGDILVIATQSGILDSGTYQIRAAGPLVAADTLGDLPILAVDELAIFHTFIESRVAGDLVSASIYKPAAVSSEYTPLACAVRNNETLTDTISILNPSLAHVTSVGFNGAVLSTDGYDISIKVGIGNEEYRELTVPDLHLERLNINRADPVSAESVAERINAFISDPDLEHHFPISAYRVGNELAIAHNWVGTDYTLEIVDGYTGNFALGLDAYGADAIGEETVGNTSSTYSVNGTALSTLNTIFSGYASITADSSTFMLYTNAGVAINPLQYGIGPGSVMHVFDHPTSNTNGSYTLFAANSTSVTLFNPEEINARDPGVATRFNVMFTHSNLSLDSLSGTETDMGLAQIVVDSSGKTFVHQRLTYGTNLGSAFEIANVSDTFPIGDVSVLVTLDGDIVDFNIIDDSISGTTVQVHEDFKGSFKLYHPNGLDFLNINIIPGTIPGGFEVVTVNEPVPSDQALLLCTAHFNGTLSVTNLVDERLFGNLSTNQIRDDFIEIFSQKPVSDLRSNGVVRGFDLMDLVYVDSITGMEAVPLSGGTAYVNGVRIDVETQKVVIQSYDENWDLVSGDKIIGINDFGSIQVVSDDLGEMLDDGYNSSSAFGKILPLYCITVTNGNLGNINNIVDVRRFINNLDDKMDMIVDESNNVVGNFRSLEGALLYADNYPSHERLTVRITNSATPQNRLIVPNGISIIGDAPYGGDGRHQIVNNSNRNNDFITLLGNNRFENIEVVSSTVGLQGALIAVSGRNVNVEKCRLQFEGTISSNSSDLGIKINADNDVRIINNKISNVYTGVSSEFGCDDLVISDNKIDGVSGIGLGCGIKIGTSLRSVTSTSIFDNIIEIDAVASTDLRGIYVDVNESINTIRINDNKISCALNVLSKNYLSNGIRIENSSNSGNKISQLMMFNNYIENVKLDDSSVYAIYVDDVERALLGSNTAINVGVYTGLYTGVAYIWINDTVDAVEINNNVLSDGAALNGIYINSTSTLVSILGNTLKNIGEDDANYIYGLSHRANVSGNKLIGPGNYGIWWRGAQSKVSNNHLSSITPLTSYAFKTGILAQASYIDIENNTIIDMSDVDSIGIANASTANDGIKIIGNTIIGTTMSKLVDLSGSYHIISGNRLRNDMKTTTDPGETYFINLAANTDGVSIIGNTFEGEDDGATAIGTAYIYSVGKVTNISITNNLMLIGLSTLTLTSAPIRLAHAEVADCLVMGNKLPPKASYPGAGAENENVVGITPDNGVYNENTIGVNRGYLDTRSLHACDGMHAYDAGDTAFGWLMENGNDYWQVANETNDSDRVLYFPIEGLPNGSTLISVNIQGMNVVQDGDVFNAIIYKRSVNEDATVAIGPTTDLAIINGAFGNEDAESLVEVTGDSEIINSAESNYYVKIIHSKADPTTAANIRIYGITINFRY